MLYIWLDEIEGENPPLEQKEKEPGLKFKLRYMYSVD